MKKEEFNYFIGIDVSKKTLDMAFVDRSGQIHTNPVCVTNDRKGMVDMTRWIKALGVTFKDVLFCMEFTGLYNSVIQNFLHTQNAFIWMEMPVRIIRSSGLQRGKNDKMDAQRIAVYAARHQCDKVRWTPPCRDQQAIKDLVNLRDRLLAAKTALWNPIGELTDMHEKPRANVLKSYCRQTIKGLDSDIEKAEEQIRTLIENMPSIKKNIQLMVSIPGVGFWTALAMVGATDNFKRSMTAKQMACYCGCAPFEHRSGTSVYGRTKVSKMANTRLKTLLTLGAISVIHSKNELAVYYKRKVAEGKNKMSVVNAVRNKIIHRIVAIIERQTPYESTLRLNLV